MWLCSAPPPLEPSRGRVWRPTPYICLCKMGGGEVPDFELFRSDCSQRKLIRTGLWSVFQGIFNSIFISFCNHRYFFVGGGRRRLSPWLLTSLAFCFEWYDSRNHYVILYKISLKDGEISPRREGQTVYPFPEKPHSTPLKLKQLGCFFVVFVTAFRKFSFQLVLVWI